MLPAHESPLHTALFIYLILIIALWIYRINRLALSQPHIAPPSYESCFFVMFTGFSFLTLNLAPAAPGEWADLGLFERYERVVNTLFRYYFIGIALSSFWLVYETWYQRAWIRWRNGRMNRRRAMPREEVMKACENVEEIEI